MLNQVSIIGHLGKDPETRYLPSGSAVTNISVATTEKWKDKDSGEKRERTEWHNVAFFGRVAEIAAEYLTKGSLVFVQGKLQTDTVEKDGVTKYYTKVVARDLKMLGGGTRGQERAQAPQQQAEPQVATGPGVAQGEFDDDIPF